MACFGSPIIFLEVVCVFFRTRRLDFIASQAIVVLNIYWNYGVGCGGCVGSNDAIVVKDRRGRRSSVEREVVKRPLLKGFSVLNIFKGY